ncbi:MAG TPA: glycoside hydrolase family 43 protein, partial [Calditrichia bacterium]|nr:glycoside hydrolase family 43 protein [Calditrichia bacterium]
MTARRDPTATVQRTFTNPILAGFYPDPSICRVGEDFYLVNSTFAWFPGIPVFHSRDLVNWNLLGHVMDRPEQLNTNGMGVSRGLFAPAISHHEGLFYLTCTLVDGGGNFVVTAENPAGPWSDPHWLPEVNGIDPSLFFDENGQAYIVYNSDAPDNKPLYPGHRSVRMFEFDYRNLRVVGEEKLLVNGGVDITQNPVWIEGPHLYRINDFYYLMAAEGGTAEDHREVIFRSKSVAGPYLPWAGNPILTQRHLPPQRPHAITSTGHADLVQTPNGDWWAVFLGIRPYPPEEQHRYNTGRETFLAPVRWTGDGWPVINPDFEEVQYRYPMPVMPADPPGPIPYSGNFTYRDEFEGAELGPNWQFLRTPLQKWYALEAGVLRISLRPESCAGSGNPALVARRQQAHCYTAETVVEFEPVHFQQLAGLVCYYNGSKFHYLHITHDEHL